MTTVALLLLALASGALADDEYTPVDWIQVTEDGGLEVQIGFFRLETAPSGCIEVENMTINNVTYSIVTSNWQTRKGDESEWVDVPGTERIGAICGIGTIPEMPGEYRPVAEIAIGEETGKYTSANTLVVAGDPDTAVEDVTLALSAVPQRMLHGLSGCTVTLPEVGVLTGIDPAIED